MRKSFRLTLREFCKNIRPWKASAQSYLNTILLYCNILVIKSYFTPLVPNSRCSVFRFSFLSQSHLKPEKALILAAWRIRDGWSILGSSFDLCQYLLTSNMDFSNTAKYMTFTVRVFICWKILFSYGKKLAGWHKVNL